MPKTYICTADEAVWTRSQYAIEVPDDVLAEGEDAVREFLHEAYYNCEYRRIYEGKLLGNVDMLDTQLDFQPEDQS